MEVCVKRTVTFDVYILQTSLQNTYSRNLLANMSSLTKIHIPLTYINNRNLLKMSKGWPPATCVFDRLVCKIHKSLFLKRPAILTVN